MKAILIFILFINTLFAQIPNYGFENWDNENAPTDWFTSNIEELVFPISKTSDSYSNSLAIKGEVITTIYGDTIIPAILSGEFGSGFKIDKRYSNFKLYYKFNSAGGDIFFVGLWMYKADQLVGGGVIQVAESVFNFALLNIPIEYLDDSTPDNCVIEILAGSSDDSYLGHPNTYFIVDDLSFDDVTKINDGINQIPTQIELNQNYPNPFNPSTNISFNLPKDENVTLNIFNVLGENVATIISGRLNAGNHNYEWNATNLPSGIYYYKLSSGNYSSTKKMLLIK